MVVTRKKPIAPVLPPSRTNSSQPLPRAVKAKATPQPAHPPSTSSDKESTENQTHGKQTKPPQDPTKSISNLLFTVFLAVFSLYAITVCPTDYTLSSPVCRSVDAYRTHVLEPYVLPPIQSYVVPSVKAAIAHPAVQPHIKTVQKALTPLRPYLGKASDFERRRVRPHIKRAANIIVASSTTIWTRVIVPRYKTQLRPHLRPYTSAAITYYDRTVLRFWNAYAVPAYHRSSTSIQFAYARVHPHIVNTKPYFIKAYSLARSYGCTAYKVAKPRVIAIYATLKPHAKVLASQLEIQAHKLTRKAGDARRQFVDPHVRRIWDKVGETSSVEDAASVDNVAEDTTPVQTTSVSGVPLDSAASVIPNSPHGAAQSSIPNEVVSSAEETISPTPSVEESVTPVHETETDISIPEETAMVTPTIETGILVSTSSVDSVPSTPTVVPEAQAQEPELDDFLRQIGLDEEGQESHDSAQQQQDQQQQQQQELLENTKSEEEKLAQIAEKRAKLVARHVRWQSELDAFVQETEKGVRRVLVGIRKGAVNELLAMNKDEDGRKGVINGVEAEGSKLLKGLEVYLKKMAGGQGRDVEREKEKWEKIVEKVGEKFTTRVRNVQEEIHVWYMGVREKEVQEVLRAGVEVKNTAEKAQADIGLDYAWLEDVTYEDWQKYHDLMRTSERFDNTIRSIQSGTHARPPADPLVPALDDLERELQNVISGFTVRVARLREEAADVFAESPEVEQGMNVAEEEQGEPQVSVLPVDPPTSGVAHSEVLENLEHVLLGKSREQVAEALGDIEVEPRSREEL